jgi:O-antigen/teichoic acid export membrane protein
VRESIKRLTTDSAVYGLGQALGRAVQLLLVPVLTRLLVPAEFGVADLVASYLGTVILVLVFGMDAALARFFYDEPDRGARIRMVSTSLLFRLAVSGVAVALLLAFGGPLAAVLMHGEAYRKYVWMGAATLPFTLLVMFCNDVLRVTFQPVKYITLNIVQTVLVTSLSIMFVGPWFHKSTAGVLYGRMAGDAVAAIVGLVLIRHALGFRFDGATLRRMLAYGAPTIPAAVAFAVIAGVDRFVLQRTRTIEEVAIYGVAARFYSVMTFAASAFQLAYGPFVYARARDPEAPRLFARVLVGYIAVASLGAMVVGLFAPEVLGVLVTRAYRPEAASLPALLLAFAAVALGAYTVASIGIGLALRTPLLAAGAWSGAIVAVAAHMLLTPRLGPVGAACATLAGYLGVAVVTYRLAQRVHRLPYRGGLAAGLFALALALAVVAQRFAAPGAWGLVTRALAVLAFAGVCAWGRVWTERSAVAARGTAIAG